MQDVRHDLEAMDIREYFDYVSSGESPACCKEIHRICQKAAVLLYFRCQERVDDVQEMADAVREIEDAGSNQN